MTDLIGTFNHDSRISVPKFSGLRSFLVFEDSCNGEGSLQVNKTSKKHWWNKMVSLLYLKKGKAAINQ